MPHLLRSSIAVTLAIFVLLLILARAPLAAEPVTAPVSTAALAPPAPGSAASPSEGDATAIEYGLIAALVAVVIIGALTALGSALDNTFDAVATELDPVPSGGSEEEHSQSTAYHERGGQTESSAGIQSDFADGAYAHSTTTATSWFETASFEFTEDASVVNAASASDEPNVKLIHRLLWTLKVQADPPPQGPPPGENAILRMDFSFSDITWGIGGPIPQQDGVFEIEGPDGSVWGWTMEKNVQTGQLEVTSANGPKPEDFAFGSGTDPVTLQGLEFQPEEVLVGVSSGPSFTFEVPYGVPTEVTFVIRRMSHTVVPDPTANVPMLSPTAQLALAAGLLLLAGWRLRRAGIAPRPVQ